MQCGSVPAVFTRRRRRKLFTRHGLRVHIFFLDAFAIRCGTVVDSAITHRSCEILTVGVCRHVFLLTCVDENVGETFDTNTVRHRVLETKPADTVSRFLTGDEKLVSQLAGFQGRRLT